MLEYIIGEIGIECLKFVERYLKVGRRLLRQHEEDVVLLGLVEESPPSR